MDWLANKLLMVFAAASLVVGSCGCQTVGPNTRNGGLIGGVTGGAIGALAGAPDGKALEGALIGAAAGGTVGGALGNSVDQQVAADRAFVSGVRQEALANSLSIAQVINMSQSGLDDQLIVNQINANGVANRLSANDLVVLQNSGVSTNVIAAMQTAPIANSVIQRAAPIRNSGVIIEERWVEPPCYYHRPYRPCRPYYRHRHPGWGFSVEF